MSRHLRLWRLFVATSVQRELEFRANFIAKLLQNMSWIVFFLLIILVIYSKTDSIAGWARGDTLVLLSTVFLMSGLTSSTFFSLYEIPEQVRRGTLDYVITRPVDSQFWVSLRRFEFSRAGSFLSGLILLAYASSTLDRSPTLVDWMFYLLSILFACAIFYGFLLFLMTLGIYFVRVENLWVLSETALDISRYPIDIYAAGVQRTLTYFLPLALIGTIPARHLVTGSNPAMLGVSALWAVGLFMGARLFWRKSLRAYTSASS